MYFVCLCNGESNFFTTYVMLTTSSGLASIVSVHLNISRYAYLSKTLMSVGQGSPVLALLKQESPLDRDVLSLQLGVSVSNIDIDGLKAGFIYFLGILKSTSNDRDRIQRLADSLYSRLAGMEHWPQILDDLDASHLSTEPES